MDDGVDACMRVGCMADASPSPSPLLCQRLSRSLPGARGHRFSPSTATGRGRGCGEPACSVVCRKSVGALCVCVLCVRRVPCGCCCAALRGAVGSQQRVRVSFRAQRKYNDSDAGANNVHHSRACTFHTLSNASYDIGICDGEANPVAHDRQAHPLHAGELPAPQLHVGMRTTLPKMTEKMKHVKSDCRQLDLSESRHTARVRRMHRWRMVPPLMESGSDGRRRQLQRERAAKAGAHEMHGGGRSLRLSHLRRRVNK